jgi:hypothetical protein
MKGHQLDWALFILVATGLLWWMGVVLYVASMMIGALLLVIGLFIWYRPFREDVTAYMRRRELRR